MISRASRGRLPVGCERATLAHVEIIVTHDVLDFDAFASAVAALKLYPGARVVLGTKLGSDVREFLALHKDRYPTLSARDLVAGPVRRAVIVDVRRASRLAHVPELRDRILARDPELEVHVWDHHGAAADDVPAQVECIEPVGSATTLLVEAIQQRGAPVDPMEATLVALGIYVDTGSLRYAATTARDAAALAWLLARGARLAVINRYANPPFSDAQLRALTAVLGALRVERIGGARVAVAIVPPGYATAGLDQVTSEALALEDVHALFACFPVRDGRLQVVARSRAAWIDVGQALRSVGGGGHATAAAATMRSADVPAAVESLLAALRAHPPQPTLVRDVMSSPVHSVAPVELISALHTSLCDWQHTGAPVVTAGKLVGIVSRRDVEAALAKGRGEDRVARHMSNPVHTTVEDALLEDALTRMATSDVGRLPVLREGRLVGIVTRRDVLAVLYAAPTA
jgi:tRNA nucleotidyltransferase (CCA-adding enzyme)